MAAGARGDDRSIELRRQLFAHFSASVGERCLFDLPEMRPLLPLTARLALAAALAIGWSACSWLHTDTPAVSEGGTTRSFWPFEGSNDATPYLEYRRTRSHGAEPLLTLTARNTHMKKTIEGQMRTTMQISPSDMKMDSQSFTLAPNEQKTLLVYPERFHLTYEVTANFKE
jgi:hypothetical protein